MHPWPLSPFLFPYEETQTLGEAIQFCSVGDHRRVLPTGRTL